MRFRRLAVLATVMVAAGMGSGTPPPPPVALPRLPPPDRIITVPVTPELMILQAADVTPEQFLFTARPVVVFADTAADAAFARQIELLQADPRTLALRDVVVIVDTDPAARSPWRLKLRPRGFSLVILDKQGAVVERKPAPWDAREIGRAIDKTPERRDETLRAGGGR